MNLIEAYKQGQRDREQGWVPLEHYWHYEGHFAVAYRLGYSQPRTGNGR
jgi:hypothetical protein